MMRTTLLPLLIASFGASVNAEVCLSASSHGCGVGMSATPALAELHFLVADVDDDFGLGSVQNGVSLAEAEEGGLGSISSKFARDFDLIQCSEQMRMRVTGFSNKSFGNTVDGMSYQTKLHLTRAKGRFEGQPAFGKTYTAYCEAP